jgi:hypothetical protein
MNGTTTNSARDDQDHSLSADRARSETRRSGRGGRRPGAGRKPNYLKRLSLNPITAAEIIARRHPESAALTPGELATLQSITSKLAEPSPDGRGNQKESNRATLETLPHPGP